ncbi:RING-H2 finger protein ATL74-like protein [Tanacetum coccineum]
MSQHAGAGGDASGLFETLSPFGRSVGASALYECLECGEEVWIRIPDSGWTTHCPGCNAEMYRKDPRQITFECCNSGCFNFRTGIRRLPSLPRGVCTYCQGPLRTREEANVYLVVKAHLDVGNIRSVAVDGRLVNQTCPICIQNFEMGDDLKLVVPCSHAFHTKCISCWLCTSNTCPNCRGELPCTHAFHTDCISNRSQISNTCPICRSELPVADGSSGSRGTPGGTRNHNNNGRGV